MCFQCWGLACVMEVREGGREGSRDVIILFLNLFPNLCNILLFTTVNIIFCIFMILYVF